jgi:hypothetical protein
VLVNTLFENKVEQLYDVTVRLAFGLRRPKYLIRSLAGLRFFRKSRRWILCWLG